MEMEEGPDSGHHASSPSLPQALSALRETLGGASSLRLSERPAGRDAKAAVVFYCSAAAARTAPVGFPSQDV